MRQLLKNKLKEQKGFTLIELLAVIVILGIIAAIAVPSIGGLINKSKNDAKVAEAIQIISAAKLAQASNSQITNWKHNADATGTPEYGGLKEYVENVGETDYIVDYTKGVYSITNHDASEIVLGTAKKDTAITEAQLIEFTK